MRDLTEQVTWRSEQEFYATISNAPGSRGLVSLTPIQPGEIVRLAAELDGVRGRAGLDFGDIGPREATVTPADPRVRVGATVGLRAIVRWSDGAMIDETTMLPWRSADPTIAGIDAPGLVRGIRVGTVTITVGSDEPCDVRANVMVVVEP